MVIGEERLDLNESADEGLLEPDGLLENSELEKLVKLEIGMTE
jgi:hypothetical protein